MQAVLRYDALNLFVYQGEEAAYKTAIAHTARVHALRNRLCTLPYFA